MNLPLPRFRKDFDGFGVVFAEKNGQPTVHCITSNKGEAALGENKLAKSMPKFLNYKDQEIKVEVGRLGGSFGKVLMDSVFFTVASRDVGGSCLFLGEEK